MEKVAKSPKVKRKAIFSFQYHHLWRGETAKVNCQWCGKPHLITLKTIAGDLDPDYITGEMEAYDED